MGTISLSLAEALPLEQKRVRKLIEMYRDPLLQGAGEFAARMMEIDLEEAEKASAEGNTIGMLKAYNELKTYKA